MPQLFPPEIIENTVECYHGGIRNVCRLAESNRCSPCTDFCKSHSGFYGYIFMDVTFRKIKRATMGRNHRSDNWFIYQPATVGKSLTLLFCRM